MDIKDSFVPVLFCNVGWMDRYDGIDGDTLCRGGAYNNESTGHEVCNFTHANGKVYGFVRPSGHQIDISKLGARKGENHVEGVTVIWTAGPDGGGTAIVGWYNNATVFREPQHMIKPSTKHRENSIGVYRISASANDAKLLPVAEREFMIPRAVKGGIGQSNIWYADKPESAQLLKEALRLVEQGTAKMPDIDSQAVGWEGNPRLVSHFRRERNHALVQKKRAAVLAETGALSCEVCDFDFAKVYGEHGQDFCEVHHLTPLHKSDRPRLTKLSDLAVVCSNCHRIIHRIDPMPTIGELKKIIFAR